jgi:hypothetical protein
MVWTEAHPKFKYGQPMLTEAELLSAGTATVRLHDHYLKGCLGNQKNGIVVKYKRSHFLHSLDT